MSRFGFQPLAGTNFATGQEAEIAKRLDQLGRDLGVTVYGISGYRSPAHSVAVGGFPNDPHTKAQAADIGVGSPSRASAAQLSDATLRKYGLVRPFKGAAEINHVQLAPEQAGGGSVVKALANASPLSAITTGDPLRVIPGVAAGAEAAKALGVGGVGNAVDSAGKAAGGLAGDVAGTIVDQLANAFGAHAARIMLYVALIGAAVTLAVLGASRAAGVTSGDVVKGAVAVAK